MKKKRKKRVFYKIPRLKLLNGIDCKLNSCFDTECECDNCKIRNDIESWKDNVIRTDDEIKIDLQIPYVWQILNARIFHWIWAYQTKAEKWITECTEIVDLKQDFM